MLRGHRNMKGSQTSKIYLETRDFEDNNSLLLAGITCVCCEPKRLDNKGLWTHFQGFELASAGSAVARSARRKSARARSVLSTCARSTASGRIGTRGRRVPWPVGRGGDPGPERKLYNRWKLHQLRKVELKPNLIELGWALQPSVVNKSINLET